MSRVLVTGAGGFIGRRVVPLLERAGHEVHRAEGDLLDPATAPRLIESARPSHLLHLAWYTKHGLFWEAPKKEAGADDRLVGGLMQLLLDLRAEARKAKNFATADQIRKRLGELGVTLEDRPGGTGWRLG